MGSRPAASTWARCFLNKTRRHGGTGNNPASAQPCEFLLAIRTLRRGSRSFGYCEGEYDAKFIIICGRKEVDDRLRKLPNIIVAKDQRHRRGAGLSTDRGGNPAYGMASGPGTMAHFRHKPYCMFKWDLKLGSLTGW
jgi:hypothetical protein